MAKFAVTRSASPNLVVRVFLQDSTVTTGAGKTGVVRTQTDLKINVIRELSAASTNYVGGTSIEDITTLGTYAAPTSANCRFKEIDSTNLPGWYEIHLEQSAGGTADASRVLSGMVRATSVAPCPFEIQLEAVNRQDSVRSGMTSLPNAAADAAGGLPISDAGGLDLDAKLANTNEVTAARMGALTDWINGGRLDLLLDDVLADTADMQPKLGTPAGASISADIAAIEAQTDDIGAAGAGLTAVPWNSAWDAEVESEANDALVVLNLDHLVGTATGIPAIPAGTFIDQIMDDGTATYDRTTDSLQAIRDRGDAAWTTGAGGTNPFLLQTTTIATLASQTSFTLTAGSADNDAYNGATVVVTDSVTSTQKAVGVVLDYVGATKTVTLKDNPAVFTMAVGDTIDILADRSLKPTVDSAYLEVNGSNQAAVQSVSVATVEASAISSASFAAGAIDATAIAANAIGASELAADAVAEIADAVWDEATSGHAGAGSTGLVLTNIEADTTDIQSRIPAALVSGRIDASVGAMAAGVVTAAAVATDAIDSDAIAASAVTEIQAGLSTLDAAGIRTAVGLATANLDTQLTTIDDFLDTEVAAIKAKTDQLVFTGANRVDANVAAVNNNTGGVAGLERATRAITTGTVGTGSTTTSVVSSALSPSGSVSDQFKGLILAFDKDTTTAALRGQKTDITASTSAATPTFTVTALTTAPVSGDTFTIE